MKERKKNYSYRKQLKLRVSVPVCPVILSETHGTPSFSYTPQTHTPVTSDPSQADRTPDMMTEMPLDQGIVSAFIEILPELETELSGRNPEKCWERT